MAAAVPAVGGLVTHRHQSTRLSGGALSLALTLPVAPRSTRPAPVSFFPSLSSSSSSCLPPFLPACCFSGFAGCCTSAFGLLGELLFLASAPPGTISNRLPKARRTPSGEVLRPTPAKGRLWQHPCMLRPTPGGHLPAAIRLVQF